jgi:hypothetical protein
MKLLKFETFEEMKNYKDDTSFNKVSSEKQLKDLQELSKLNTKE